ncbi:MAG: folylpolyglutamate synthase/dihydrofolate synthase family protein [Candidatus Hinthialibacter antarcticus]|nr:folylpolyglutamate synthase/dihydrofolate synthase family protein [Candidatus Hinthialibacter antarcticus]
MKNLHDALNYLYSFVSYERKANWNYSDKTLNLDRFRKLLKDIGNPQDGLRIIHVAGSDGKGSTCAFLSALLQAKGCQVGLYTSPHLHHIRERIQINGKCISAPAFVRWTQSLKETVERRRHPSRGYATFFELLTAMAFLYFRERGVDYAVIETGLGGRLDATNVADPLVSVITHISMEHAHLLGDTLEEIADEKLGIIRPNAPVVVGSQDPALLPHFKQRLREHKAQTVFTDQDYAIGPQQVGPRGRKVVVNNTRSHQQWTLRIPLVGRYQGRNALTALAALQALEQSGAVPAFTQRELRRGFASVQWPGRFEVIRRARQAPIVLDVAHTVKGAAALRESLDESFPKQRRVFVCGFLQDKNAAGMVKELCRPDDVLVLTQAPTPRGMSIEQIETLLQQNGVQPPRQIERRTSPRSALRRAVELARPRDVIVIAGSLYLIGALRNRCIKF